MSTLELTPKQDDRRTLSPRLLARRSGTFAIYLWLLALVLLPNGLMLIYSLWTAGDLGLDHTPTLNNYKSVFTSSTNVLLLGRTLGTAVAVAVFATVIGASLAYVVSQKLSRARMLAVILVVIPLWVSLLIRVFAWKIILGENGILNTGLVNLGLTDEPIGFLLYTRFSVVLTLLTVTIPYVFVTSYSAIERVPKSVLEASSDLGASNARRLCTVIWPLIRPGVGIGFLLAFVISVGDYLSPSLVGGLDGTMVGSVIVSQFGIANNWPLGAALAIVLLIAVILVGAAIVRSTRTSAVLEGDVGEGIPTEPVPASESRRKLLSVLAFIYLIAVYGLLYLPLLMIALFSFNDSRVQALPIEGLTLSWYEQLANSPDLIAAFQRSVIVALGAVILSLAAGTIFALVIAFNRPRAAATLQGALTLPFLLPGVILGLSLAIVFRTIGAPFGLLTVTIGHATFITPIVMAVVLARLRQMDPGMLEAALDLGARPFKAFMSVVAPQLRTALIGAFLLGLTLSFDEVLVTFFLAGDQPTLPVYIYNQLRFGFTPTINALFTCIVVVTISLLLIALKFAVGRGAKEKAAEALGLS